MESRDEGTTDPSPSLLFFFFFFVSPGSLLPSPSSFPSPRDAGGGGVQKGDTLYTKIILRKPADLETLLRSSFFLPVSKEGRLLPLSLFQSFPFISFSPSFIFETRFEGRKEGIKKRWFMKIAISSSSFILEKRFGNFETEFFETNDGKSPRGII